MPQPLLFNIFLADLYFIVDEIAIGGYADYNTPYISGNGIDGVIGSLEEAAGLLFKWFPDNLKKYNADRTAA